MFLCVIILSHVVTARRYEHFKISKCLFVKIRAADIFLHQMSLLNCRNLLTRFTRFSVGKSAFWWCLLMKRFRLTRLKGQVLITPQKSVLQKLLWVYTFLLSTAWILTKKQFSYLCIQRLIILTQKLVSVQYFWTKGNFISGRIKLVIW
jgi:hypothetical protein